jgi:hypothetical protein
MRKVFDALIDIIVIAVLVFTAMSTINDVFMKYLICVVGCGAMFNNFKYLYEVKKDKPKEPKEPK